MSRGDQLFRQWTILQELAGGQKSRRQLADALEVSRRTITRDIEALSLFPISEQREGIDVFYSLLPGARTPGVRFESDEVAATLLAKSTILAALEDTPVAEQVAAVLAKVELLQRDNTARTRGHQPDVFLSNFAKPAREGTVQEQLLDAAMQHKLVCMRYFTVERNATQERTVEPYFVHRHPHGLHLIAYCLHRQAFLYFSIGQIRKLNVLDVGFDPAGREVDLASFLDTVFDGRRGEPVQEVLLRIAHPTAHWAREHFYHRNQVVTEVEGGIEIRFTAGAPAAIAARVLSLGPDCEVLSPPSLREEVAKKAGEIHALYEKS